VQFDAVLMTNVTPLAAAPVRALGFAAVVHEALIGDGREEERQRMFVAEERDAGVDRGDVFEHARTETDALVRFAIPAQRDVVGRAAGEELVDHVRQPLARVTLEVVESEEVIHGIAKDATRLNARGGR
jgi:hypothetical protein